MGGCRSECLDWGGGEGEEAGEGYGEGGVDERVERVVGGRWGRVGVMRDPVEG